MELGNQQRRYGWFGGIVDGEGYLCLVRTQETRSRTFKLTPRFGVVNTDSILIAEIESILREAGVPFHRNDRPATKRWKKTMRVTVSGMKRCLTFLNVFEPYLIAKVDRARLLREFIHSRTTRPKGSAYNPRELAIYHGLKIRNSRPSNPLNDYTPDTSHR